MNRIKVLFFATLRDRVGARSVEMDLSGETTVQGLKDRLAAEYPKLGESMKSALVAINQEYAFDEAIIPASAEIAIFPPVSGG
jgi:molybdopterin converting factor subunit 1